MKRAPLMSGLESHPWELNPEPGAYEASALPIELGWHVTMTLYPERDYWQGFGGLAGRH